MVDIGIYRAFKKLLNYKLEMPRFSRLGLQRKEDKLEEAGNWLDFLANHQGQLGSTEKEISGSECQEAEGLGLQTQTAQVVFLQSQNWMWPVPSLKRVH